MEWSDKLATGDPVIDEQHRTILTWVQELETAAAESRLLATTYALTRLSKHMATHFSDEEALMAKHGYPQLAAHKAEHEAFLVKLRELQGLSREGDISEITITFLQDWLVRHMMNVDQDYVPYL